MTLNELKKMIAEEYSAFMKEQATPPMPTTPGPTINVADNDVDVEGGDKDAESTLKNIFDMLKDYFEGGDAEAPEAPEAEEEEEEEEEEDVNENSTGKNAGYKEIKESKKAEAKKLISEANFKTRFKTLANIK